MLDIVYRQATEQDIVHIAEIRARSSATKEYWFDRIDKYRRGLQNPREALEPRVLYLASLHNHIVAFIAGHLTHRLNCQGELQWIDTVKECRRKSIASHLIRMLAKWFIENKAYKICVDPGDQTARDFYYKNGATDLNQHWLHWNDIRTIL
jgi:GNAT superfamily N-acetyltransferase